MIRSQRNVRGTGPQAIEGEHVPDRVFQQEVVRLDLPIRHDAILPCVADRQRLEIDEGLVQSLHDAFGACLTPACTKVDAVTPIRMRDFRRFTRARFFGENEATSCRRTAPRLARNMGEPIFSATSMLISRSTASA
jgi:hypothetical protein